MRPAAQPKPHAKLLKLPVAITLAVLALFAAIAYAFHLLKPAEQPAIIGADTPAAIVSSIAFYKEGGDYAMYFTLYDATGREVARTGEAKIKISLLGTIGIEGGPEFVSETVVLDARLEVGLTAYRWMDAGKGLLFDRRQLIVPQKVTTNAFTKLPHTGAKCKIAVEFRDGKSPESKANGHRVFLFP